VFCYKSEITLNNKFNKSTNIILDKEDCIHYIITQSTKNTLNSFPFIVLFVLVSTNNGWGLSKNASDL